MTPAEMTLVVLVGGESSRMGTPKHLLPLPGGTILDRILDRLGGMFGDVIVAGRGLRPMREGVRTVDDVRCERCPLVGILSGLQASRTAFSFVIACDMPFVEPSLVELLASKAGGGVDVVVPVVGGFFEPLCAVYGRAVTGAIAECLDSGRTKTTSFFGSARLAEVDEREIRSVDPALASFVNLNTPSDYLRHCASS